MEYPAPQRQESAQDRRHVAQYGTHLCSPHCFTNTFLIHHGIIQMLAAIGETFDPALTEAESEDSVPQSLITGVIVSTRPQFYRISIWTRSAPAPDDDRMRKRIEAIGRHFKTVVLGFSESQKLAGPLATEVEFLSHKDSEKKGKQGKKPIVV